MIILTKEQHEMLKGNYDNSYLLPLIIPFKELYYVSENVLNDANFLSIREQLEKLPKANVEIQYNNEGEPVNSFITYNWKHDYPLRIIVPKSLIQKYREILIFKSYFEVIGLPIEILPDEIHLYCNEILEQDAPIISQLNLVVEQKPF